ncbi:cysteine desulfurase / selenocysteine lyase [Candidatus Moduliflexus flocculans]|uniref:cysteine desulfurase n=1 Tax=Candidatus Moduliflexus flocculans TaxID=1499966 RepID=A0A0S6W5X9_9BACT|nr:cysteine desulfurase / selenocysteine lyase [Candidatus Moduliflexus flocculans]
MIYFDNAATSWPKPPCVAEAMTRFLADIGASPGRGGHRLSVEAGRLVYETREAIAELFHAPDSLRVIFTHNVTESLNLALCGLLRPGQHVITSSMEHNSMMRPLRALEEQGIELSVISCSPEGLLNAEDVCAAIRQNTVMIALNHASNVIGTIQPIRAIGAIARERNLLFLLDAAQSAGVCSIDMAADQIDLLAFTGHKALLGPTGTGGLIIGERVKLSEFTPLKRGGTGSASELEIQPGFLPDRFESGTLNAVGLAGLSAALCWLRERDLEQIRADDIALTRLLLNGLRDIPGVTVYGTGDATRQTATVSFNIEQVEPSSAAFWLDEEFGICCRVGLHCSPAAHKTIGTFPRGTIRFGLGAFNTPDEINAALAAVRFLARSKR